MLEKGKQQTCRLCACRSNGRFERALHVGRLKIPGIPDFVLLVCSCPKKGPEMTPPKRWFPGKSESDANLISSWPR